MFSTKRSLCGAIVLLSPAAAFAQRGAPPNNIVVDVTPSHAVSSFQSIPLPGRGHRPPAGRHNRQSHDPGLHRPNSIGGLADRQLSAEYRTIRGSLALESER